jgi:hypothetical protein
VLEISTDQPAIQLYSGNLLDGTLVGPGGRAYGFRHGLALGRSTSHSPNHPGFPSTVLEPSRALSRGRSTGCRPYGVSELTERAAPSSRRLVFGTLDLPDDVAPRLLDRFHDAGGRALDLANVYCEGESQLAVGKWLPARPPRRHRDLRERAATRRTAGRDSSRRRWSECGARSSRPDRRVPAPS